jgi:hypothetical protein
VATLGQFGRRAGVDEREEVGAVVGEGAQRKLELVDESLRKLAFGSRDVMLCHEIEMIPEGLAGELTGGRRNEPGQRGRAIPVGEAEFADGTDGPVDGGEQQIVSDGEPLVALGQMAIEEFDESDLLSEIIESDDIAKGRDIDGLRLRRLALLLLQSGRDQIVGRA